MEFHSVYPLWSMDVSDLINNEFDPQEIANFSVFKAFLPLYKPAAVFIHEIGLHVIESGVVYPLVSMDITLGGRVFNITVSMEDGDLIHFVNFNSEQVARILGN